MRQKYDLVGRRFGRLKVIRKSDKKRGPRIAWVCECRCGKLSEKTSTALVCGLVKSCGCLAIDTARSSACHKKTHGLGHTLIYWKWINMVKRCHDKDGKDFKNYGARGIQVCNWIRKDPRNLKAIMGRNRPRKTIDRIDNNGHYSCGSCEHCVGSGWPMNLRWATATEQIRNRRVTIIAEYRGEKRPLVEWCDKKNINAGTVSDRLKRGWDIKTALETKPGELRMGTYNPYDHRK